MGLGHPLIDALLAYLKSPNMHGEVAKLQDGQDGPFLSGRWVVTVRLEAGKSRRHYRHVAVNGFGSVRNQDERRDLHQVETPTASLGRTDLKLAKLKEYAETDLNGYIAELRAGVDGRSTIRAELVGLAVFTS